MVVDQYITYVCVCLFSDGGAVLGGTSLSSVIGEPDLPLLSRPLIYSEEVSAGINYSLP